MKKAVNITLTWKLKRGRGIRIVNRVKINRESSR